MIPRRILAILLSLCLFAAFAAPSRACAGDHARASAGHASPHAPQKTAHQAQICCASQCCGVVALSSAGVLHATAEAEAFFAEPSTPKAATVRPSPPPPRRA